MARGSQWRRTGSGQGCSRPPSHPDRVRRLRRSGAPWQERGLSEHTHTYVHMCVQTHMHAHMHTGHSRSCSPNTQNSLAQPCCSPPPGHMNKAPGVRLQHRPPQNPQTGHLHAHRPSSSFQPSDFQSLGPSAPGGQVGRPTARLGLRQRGHPGGRPPAGPGHQKATRRQPHQQP